MKTFTHWVVAKTIKNHKNTRNKNVRAHYGALEGWTSIGGNLALFIIKLIAGIAIQSIALIADAFHTLSDCATSIVVIIGFYLAKKPSDKEHPFGHGRMESVATLIVAILLCVTGIELLKSSAHAFIQPKPTAASTSILILIAGTVIIKELMARFAFELGTMIDSKTLTADAAHHRSDAFTTILVLIALITAKMGFMRIDGIAGIAVSAAIMHTAYTIAKDAITPLLGEAPTPDTIQTIEQLAKQHKGVQGVHDIIYNCYGQTCIISLHIEVSDKDSPENLHELSEQVEETISKKMNGMVIVHIDPINKDHPQYDIIAQTISDLIATDQRITSFHELRIVGCSTKACNIVFDVVTEDMVKEEDAPNIIRALKRKLKSHFPDMQFCIKAEPKFAYTLPNEDL